MIVKESLPQTRQFDFEDSSGMAIMPPQTPNIFGGGHFMSSNNSMLEFTFSWYPAIFEKNFIFGGKGIVPMGLPSHYVFLQVTWPGRLLVFMRSEITQKLSSRLKMRPFQPLKYEKE
jgi:hypothetical protein